MWHFHEPARSNFSPLFIFSLDECALSADSLNSPITVSVRWSESALAEVFSTGNIHPATCAHILPWHCVHWNRPPFLSISPSTVMIYWNNNCFVDGCMLSHPPPFVNTIFHFSHKFFLFVGLLLVVLCKNIYLYVIFSLFKKSGIRWNRWNGFFLML